MDKENNDILTKYLSDILGNKILKKEIMSIFTPIVNKLLEILYPYIYLITFIVIVNFILLITILFFIINPLRKKSVMYR